jgi:intraflagellar transport protein 74
LEAKKKELEDKLNENSLTFEEIRAKLMDKVKTEKGEIISLENHAKELRKLTEKISKRLTKITNIENGEGEMNEEQKSKFEVLHRKEKEVNMFLESFDALRKKKLAEVEFLESANVKLAESIARNLKVLSKTPNHQELEQQSNELNFKKQQTENSEQTLERVQIEHCRRQEELQRVDEIQETLPERITQFRKIIETLKEEIGKLENPEKDKNEIIKKTMFLKDKVKFIDSFKEVLNREIDKLESEFNDQSKKLQTHEQFPAFFEKEKKLSQTAQLEASIINFIQLKENDCDFSANTEKISEVLTELNALLIAKNK